MSLRLYPPVRVEAQSFDGVKVRTVPNQNMSLQDIIKRFIRKESLPVEKDCVFHEGLGDLEKLQYEDITVRKEYAASLRAKLAKAEANAAAAEKAATALAGKGVPVESPSVGGTPLGGVTGSPVVGQAPPAAPVV